MLLKVDLQRVRLHYPIEVILRWETARMAGHYVHPETLMAIPDGIWEDAATIREIKRWLEARKKSTKKPTKKNGKT